MSRPRICYIYSEQPDYVRVEKVLKTLTSIEADFFYIGCRRGSHSKRSVQPMRNVTHNVANFAIPHGGLRSGLYTLRFLCYAVYKVVIIRPDMVIAVNEEIALPFVTFFPRTTVICEAYDSLSMRAPNTSKLLSRVLKMVSRFVLSKCDALVEVSPERLEAHRSKPPEVRVVPNSLSKENYPDDNRICEELQRTVCNRQYIFVSGSFSDEINGLEELLEAVERLDGKLTIIAAGRPNGKWVSTVFVRHHLVKYVGVVTPAEAIYITSKSKGIFAYYKPISELYKYAAPNKIFDAMAVGVPIIMNNECVASQFAVDRGFGLTGAYADIALLSRNLRIVSDGACQFDSVESVRSFNTTYEWSVTSGEYKKLVQLCLRK